MEKQDTRKICGLCRTNEMTIQTITTKGGNTITAGHCPQCDRRKCGQCEHREQNGLARSCSNCGEKFFK